MSSSDKLTGLITRFQLMTLLCKGVIRDALETDQVIDLQVMIKELSDVYSMSGTCRVVGIIFTKRGIATNSKLDKTGNAWEGKRGFSLKASVTNLNLDNVTNSVKEFNITFFD